MQVKIIGAGLAGCEAALWLADRGVQVELYEQKPAKYSPAHKSAGFAELICSNSLKAERPDSASGLLKIEMKMMGSHLLDAAETARVAAGGALAVDRDVFSTAVTEMVENHPNITVRREEVTALDESAPVLVASGPLTEGALAQAVAALTGDHRLSFYDAVAPIVTAESLDYDKVFAASRYGRGEADYLNCPFNKEEYEAFHAALIAAERAPLHDFDGDLTVYEGCMPIEVMAARGADTIRFGPLRPVGLRDPRTGHRPWAAVQLRAENTARTLYNLVGFQTNLKWGEQKRVFSMIPGLEHAEFVRYGVMHRNTFLESPKVLTKQQFLKEHPNVFFAGQITGFEGYMESAASGLLAAHQMLARLKDRELQPPPAATMCGALLDYITTPNKDFQPMGANMGILPRTEEIAQDAHEAIRPSMPELTPDEVEQSISGDTAKLYRLIWSRFMASQMADCIQDTVSASITAGDYLFRASGFRVSFDGFTALYEESTDDAKKKETALPPLEEGQTLKLKKLTADQKFTQPPPLYTEATLIHALEENGIGRPSTYAPIITTIVDRGYVEKDQKKLKTTPLGQAVNTVMMEQFPDIVNVKFSADMEKKLDVVEAGQADWVKTIDDFYQGFEKSLEQAEKNMEGKRIKVEDIPTDEICEKCGRPMVIKSGRYGKFVACSGFPECRNAHPLVKDTGGLCPLDGGHMLVRKSAKGRVYYGCSNYPKCNYMTWDEPVPEKCPQCGSTLFKKKGQLYCAKEGCGFVKAIEKK